jgi:hypothetical protein
MKFLLVLFAFSSRFVIHGLRDVECNNEGCYELVKHFAELLEQKIIATDAVSLK